MGFGIYCLASMGYDDPAIYDWIIRYSDPNPHSIRYASNNRVYSLKSLAHVFLPEDNDQRRLILNRMNQALDPDDPFYQAVCEALLETVDSMTQSEINLLLEQFYRVLDRIRSVDEESVDSPQLNDALGIFKVIQKLGDRASELQPMVNQMALGEIKEPGYSRLIYWQNSVIEAAAETAASFDAQTRQLAP